jgi:hypothetical protein
VGRETVERAGGVVRNIRVVQGCSTSSIIQKVLDVFGGDASSPDNETSLRPQVGDD